MGTLRSVHICSCLECLESFIAVYCRRSQVAPAPRQHPRRLGLGAVSPGCHRPLNMHKSRKSDVWRPKGGLWLWLSARWLDTLPGTCATSPQLTP